MREFCCKILATAFIVLMMGSLLMMHREFQKQYDYVHGPHIIDLVAEIKTFDTVLAGPHRHVGVVEQVTNCLYHVVFQDEFKNTVHGVYTKDQLQKVLIIKPHSHSRFSK